MPDANLLAVMAGFPCLDLYYIVRGAKLLLKPVLCREDIYAMLLLHSLGLPCHYVGDLLPDMFCDCTSGPFASFVEGFREMWVNWPWADAEHALDEAEKVCPLPTRRFASPVYPIFSHTGYGKQYLTACGLRYRVY